MNFRRQSKLRALIVFPNCSRTSLAKVSRLAIDYEFHGCDASSVKFISLRLGVEIVLMMRHLFKVCFCPNRICFGFGCSIHFWCLSQFPTSQNLPNFLHFVRSHETSIYVSELSVLSKSLEVSHFVFPSSLTLGVSVFFLSRLAPTSLFAIALGGRTQNLPTRDSHICDTTHCSSVLRIREQIWPTRFLCPQLHIPRASIGTKIPKRRTPSGTSHSQQCSS